MTHWIDLGKGGALVIERIVAIARVDSAPIRRLLEAVGRSRVVDLTFGRPRRAVAVLDSGHIVIVSMAPQMLLERFAKVVSVNGSESEEVGDDLAA
ncbi:MAG: DUF370 domain-containing protein [Anaerolineae bacterium]|nr:DUF370 domain-containing protein [Anaerolineae bacterium]